MTQSISSFPEDDERASLFTSSKGSVSIEAAFVIPIFFLGICCLCYLMEMMAIQSYIRGGLHSVGEKIAKETYLLPIVSPTQVEKDLLEYIGEERLNRSIIKGGSSGLDAGGTMVIPGTGIIRMQVKYEIVLPISFFGKLSMKCEDSFRIKGWTGYTKESFLNTRENIVYITENGMVYHKDYHCTYLDLSIQMVSRKQVPTLRNQSGEKYRACEICGGKVGENVYITKQGNRFHSSLGCSGIKRRVYAVPKSEVLGKGACSKCGL